MPPNSTCKSVDHSLGVLRQKLENESKGLRPFVVAKAIVQQHTVERMAPTTLWRQVLVTSTKDAKDCPNMPIVCVVLQYIVSSSFCDRFSGYVVVEHLLNEVLQLALAIKCNKMLTRLETQ